MKARLPRPLRAVCLLLCALPAAAQEYFPDPGDAWVRKAPREVGMDAELLDEAVRWALEHETSVPVNLEKMLTERFAGQPHQEVVGPLTPRGGPNGLVLRHGHIVAEWGDTRRVDMTFSVTKSYLATVAGLAVPIPVTGCF